MLVLALFLVLYASGLERRLQAAGHRVNNLGRVTDQLSQLLVSSFLIRIIVAVFAVNSTFYGGAYS